MSRETLDRLSSSTGRKAPWWLFCFAGLGREEQLLNMQNTHKGYPLGSLTVSRKEMPQSTDAVTLRIQKLFEGLLRIHTIPLVSKHPSSTVCGFPIDRRQFPVSAEKSIGARLASAFSTPVAHSILESHLH